MSITLETVLGTTKPLDLNTVTVNRVENIENPEIDGPLTTANFVRNIHPNRGSDGYDAKEAEEISRYVVINRPENLGQLLLETIAKDEYERASLYVLEIEEWNDRERKKMEDWEEGEQRRIEEYQLEQEITEEEARKDLLGLVLKGFSESDMPVGGIISTYKQEGFLYLNQKNTLLKLLKIRNCNTDFLTDMEEILNGRAMIDEERTWEILTKQFNVKIPTVEAPEATEPPKIELKEVPPLLNELEAVVISPYNRQSLESLNLTQEAWNAAGINHQEFRNKAIKDAIPLNDQYLLVRVVGKSEKDSGNLNLAQIISSTPKVLRPYFRRPAEIAYDAYALMGIIARAIDGYFTEDEEGKKTIGGIRTEKQPFFERAIVEEMLKRNTPLASVMFPNWHAVIVSDKEPYFATSFKESKSLPEYSIGQKWYATNVTQTELQRYRDIATKVVPEIKARFAESQFAVKRESDGEVKDITDLTQMADIVRSLVDSVPSEYFELMEANAYIKVAEDVNTETARLKREGKVPIPPVALLYRMRLDLGAESEKRSQTITTMLGRFLMKGTNEWQWELPGSVVASTIFKYGIGNTLKESAYTAKPL